MNGTATDLDLASAMKPRADPWTTMIAWLRDGAADGSHAEGRSSQPVRRVQRENTTAPRRSIAADRARTPSTRAKTVRVTVVERFNAKSVSITWRDATAANYCEQLWIRRIARSQGVCVLTGTTIARGDAVYSPASRAADRATNCAQMVLAQVLESPE